MKKRLTILLILFVGIGFFGCEDDSITNSEGDVSQIVLVFADHDNSYWDNETDQEIQTENTSVGGYVHDDPVPEFVHLKLGETVFSGADYSENRLGYIAFGDYTDMATLITSDLNPLDVEVVTSYGTLKGEISLPDNITTLGLSTYDNLPINESFTISWTGSNADFYYVYCSYIWLDEYIDLHLEVMDEFVNGNSITFPGSDFPHNGEIWTIHVQPMNGPFPEKANTENMAGEGSGFLYYRAAGKYYDGDDITVGTGLFGSMAKKSFEKPNEVVIQERINTQVENIILGNK